MKQNKNLLNDCEIRSQKLRNNLTTYLTPINSTFRELIEDIGVTCKFPVKLSGTIKKLCVEDSAGRCFLLCFFKTSVILKKSKQEYDIAFKYDSQRENFGIYAVTLSLDDIYISIDLDFSSIRVLDNLTDGIEETIFLEDDINLITLIRFCLKNKDIFFNEYEIKKALNKFASNSYIVGNYNEFSA